MIYFYDTNALIERQEEAFKHHFYLSSVTLQELENIKTNRNKSDSVKYAARTVTKLLNRHSNYTVIIYGREQEEMIQSLRIEETADSKICACAASILSRPEYTGDFLFITADLCCKAIAKQVFHLQVEDARDEGSSIYKGYKEITGTASDINLFMENIDPKEWLVNEYLIAKTTDGSKGFEMRFDGKNFVPLKLPSSKFIKGKNALQRCAIDLLANPDITVCAVLGSVGSGKTYITTNMALYSVNEKGYQSSILGLREVVGEGREIGYLPGEKDDKINDFFDPIVDQLEGKEYELNRLKEMGVIKVDAPYFIKGRTFSHTCVLVDEAEDLTEKQIRLIGTRVGEGSQIFFNGDYRQSVFNSSGNNPVVKMCNRLKGNSMFACIYLDQDVRSSTSQLFATLFD